jgi:hypothetical protein
MKSLVYYTIGCKRGYIEMLDLSIQSLRKVYSGAIGILCDESMLSECKEKIPDAIYWSVPDSETGQIASMNKLRVFDFIEVDDYDAVLYLDADILAVNPIDSYFEGITEDGMLYVYTESDKQDRHKELFWSLQTYTEEDYAFLRRNNILPFNAGAFGFRPTQVMKDQFQEVRDSIASHTGPYFYEQSFLNVYFNLRNKTVRTLFTPDTYIFFPQTGTPYKNARLLHFADASQSATRKCNRMRDYLELRVFPTRIEMLSVVPTHGVYAEIGVFKAEFSDILCKVLQPRELALIDLFSGMTNSGDQDGNNMEVVNIGDVYNHLVAVSKTFPALRVLKGDSSSILRTFPNNTFDMIYIDGDHSYEGVKKDLHVALLKVKPGGWILGHDFGINFEKARHYYEFGVERAVREVCGQFDQGVTVLGMDGCISFGIRVRKDGDSQSFSL